MSKCPSCGFHNRDTHERCLKCKTLLAGRDELVPSEPIRLPRFDLISACRRTLSRSWRRLSASFAVPLPTGLSRRYHFVAAFLSLAPGLGQIYNHQPKKIPYFIIPFLIFLALAIHYIKTPYVGNFMIASAAAVSLLSYADALVTAARINGQFFSTRNVLAACTYPFFALGLIAIMISILTYIKFPTITLFRINYDYMEPAFNKGDRLWGEGLTYIFRDPRPGEVVRYDPPRYVTGDANNDYIINPQNGWERVMAVGGETLERREGIFYVDDRPLSQEFYPLLTENLPMNFEIKCPKDQYVILISWRARDDGFINKLKGHAGVTVPPLGGRRWLQACVVPESTFFEPTIFDRTLFIYHPAERRRVLTPKGERFAATPPSPPVKPEKPSDPSRDSQAPPPAGGRGKSRGGE